MHRAWILPTLFSLVSLASAKQSIENTAVLRTIELGGSLIHVTTAYAIKALDDDEVGSSLYTVALDKAQKTRTSWLSFKVKGGTTALQYVDLGCNDESDACLFDVHLPKSLKRGETSNLVMETVETSATTAFPKFAAQNDDQSLKYRTNLLIQSPYKTLTQRTKFKSPSPRILSHTIPKDVEKFTLDNPVTKSGSTVTYGPFNDVEDSVNAAFAQNSQQIIELHYVYPHSVLEISKYSRAAEISHWGANLNIQDEISLYNAGPQLKGHFSRLDHQMQNAQRRLSAHIIAGLGLHLPAGITNVYYYDVIGNISTSALRPAPSKSRQSLANKFTLFEMRPRYPIMGGWNFSFTMGWDSPLADSAVYEKKTGQYVVAVPIMTNFPGAVVRNADVTIILPEGAIDVEAVPPFDSDASSISTHISYLDTTGRPALKLHYNLLTDRHVGLIYVSYKVPTSAHFRKPLAVAAAIMSLFVFGFGARRFDSRLSKKKH